MGFKVQGLRFGVGDLSRVSALGFRVGLRVWGLGLGLRAYGLRFRALRPIRVYSGLLGFIRVYSGLGSGRV